MARDQKKSIEEKNSEKEELIKALNTRIEKENKELKVLLRRQKQKEVDPV